MGTPGQERNAKILGEKAGEIGKDGRHGEDRVGRRRRNRAESKVRPALNCQMGFVRGALRLEGNPDAVWLGNGERIKYASGEAD